LAFNATFSNISAISWRPVLVVEEAGIPGENHRLAAREFIVHVVKFPVITLKILLVVILYTW